MLCVSSLQTTHQAKLSPPGGRLLLSRVRSRKIAPAMSALLARSSTHCSAPFLRNSHSSTPPQTTVQKRRKKICAKKNAMIMNLSIIGAFLRSRTSLPRRHSVSSTQLLEVATSPSWWRRRNEAGSNKKKPINRTDDRLIRRNYRDRTP